VKKSVIIVAGGIGSRMQSELPKQFLLLDGKPLLQISMEAFLHYDPEIEIILVLPESQIEYWKQVALEQNIQDNYKIAKGGATRFHSVKNGLGLATGQLIAVHDAVRPLVSIPTIDAVFQSASITGAAIPAIEVNDTIRLVDEHGHSKTLMRSHLRSIQTPQAFKVEIMAKAFSFDYQALFTDCASVVEHAGFNVSLVQGNTENIKITHPQDLQLAELLLSRTNQ
jgi:2-C-methyl-D-erythritol 4-phosphate cytidylyltransferase